MNLQNYPIRIHLEKTIGRELSASCLLQRITDRWYDTKHQDYDYG